MKLSLQQTEIEAAIRAYVTSQGINTAGKLVIMDFTMGRKGTGLTVDVDITSPSESVTVAEVAIPVNPAVVVTAHSETEEENKAAEVNIGYSTPASVSGSLFGNN